MHKHILYAGDDSLREAAAYLAGVMTHYSLPFQHVASSEPFSDQLLTQDQGCVVLSDYPSRNFTNEQMELLAERVRTGAGLLMIGGWSSFCGADGGYQGSALAEVLPVVLESEDDRVNCPQPCLVEKRMPHPTVDGLPFETVCPGIGGFNRLNLKPGATEILSARPFHVNRVPEGYSFVPQASAPLLVVGTWGGGNVAALATDVAPHWVGGLVDWGDGRVHAQARGANPVEVGNWYARLLFQIVRWTARL
jgi:uncharacterized membrane protein